MIRIYSNIELRAVVLIHFALIFYAIINYFYIKFPNIFSLLVTGSEDLTVFTFAIAAGTDTYPIITPIGFIKVSSGVTCLTWKPQRVIK